MVLVIVFLTTLAVSALAAQSVNTSTTFATITFSSYASQDNDR